MRFRGKGKERKEEEEAIVPSAEFNQPHVRPMEGAIAVGASTDYQLLYSGNQFDDNRSRFLCP